MLLSYRNIKRALARKKVLANARERVLFMTILPEFGILGIPDSLDCSDGRNPIIVETKTRDVFPKQPWADHELQVVIYMMGLERLGFSPAHGILEYVKRNDLKERKKHTILLNNSLRQKAISTAKTVVNLLAEKEEPIATKNPNKCVPCRFNESCRWKPIP
jgi:CRISPR/Cas system-associated exonuclease Cas4 (RecB family)